MDTELIKKIDSKIEEYTDSLKSDTVKLVRIKSTEGKPRRKAPFGKGAKRVLDTFKKMSRKGGFYCRDYGVGVVSVAMKSGDVDLGIWLHGDVVPTGDGWRFKPYSATEYKGCIIGRGATDNKGQLAAVYNLFKIFKELGIELKYNPAIYLGSNEESGMGDIVGVPANPDAKGFLKVAAPPRLSLVPDGGFPLGYGGKGGMNVTLRSNSPLSFTFTAGQPESPGTATAVFSARDIPEDLSECTVSRLGKSTEVCSFSPPRHGASPDPNGNMITKLSAALLDCGLAVDEERYILEFLRAVSLDVYGEMLGIKCEHEILGKLTVFTKEIDCKDGYIEVSLNIRYPLGICYEEIVERIKKKCGQLGFCVVYSSSGTEPYMLDPNNEVADALYRAAKEVTGEEKAPYTISGTTYAHRLPNAYVYGMNGCLPPDDFPAGHGGAHGIDESVSLDRLKRAMRIYARALLSLDELEW